MLTLTNSEEKRITFTLPSIFLWILFPLRICSVFDPILASNLRHTSTTLIKSHRQMHRRLSFTETHTHSHHVHYKMCILKRCNLPFHHVVFCCRLKFLFCVYLVKGKKICFAFYCRTIKLDAAHTLYTVQILLHHTHTQLLFSFFSHINFNRLMHCVSMTMLLRLHCWHWIRDAFPVFSFIRCGASSTKNNNFNGI